MHFIVAINFLTVSVSVATFGQNEFPAVDRFIVDVNDNKSCNEPKREREIFKNLQKNSHKV